MLGDEWRTCLGGAYNGTAKTCGKVVDGNVLLSAAIDSDVCNLLSGVGVINGRLEITYSPLVTQVDCLSRYVSAADSVTEPTLCNAGCLNVATPLHRCAD